MPPLLLKLIFDRLDKGPAPFFLKPLIRKIADTAKSSFIEPQIKLHLDYLEAEMSKSAWFAGPELSIADIQMSFPLEAAPLRAAASTPRGRISRASRDDPRPPGLSARAQDGRPL